MIELDEYSDDLSSRGSKNLSDKKVLEDKDNQAHFSDPDFLKKFNQFIPQNNFLQMPEIDLSDQASSQRSQRTFGPKEEKFLQELSSEVRSAFQIRIDSEASYESNSSGAYLFNQDLSFNKSVSDMN